MKSKSIIIQQFSCVLHATFIQTCLEDTCMSQTDNCWYNFAFWHRPVSPRSRGLLYFQRGQWAPPKIQMFYFIWFKLFSTQPWNLSFAVGSLQSSSVQAAKNLDLWCWNNLIYLRFFTSDFWSPTKCCIEWLEV